jgi:hypothetical protein
MMKATDCSLWPVASSLAAPCARWALWRTGGMQNAAFQAFNRSRGWGPGPSTLAMPTRAFGPGGRDTIWQNVAQDAGATVTAVHPVRLEDGNFC